MEQKDFEYQLQEERNSVRPDSYQPQNVSNTFMDPNDGTVYEWDEKQRGWFPKIDDAFLATYQANYGIATTTTESGSGTFAIPTGLPPSRVKAAAEAEASEKPKMSTEPESQETGTKRPNTEPAESKEVKKEVPTWFEMAEEKNNNVYVSGLPLDITMDEYTELMTKYGIIMDDDTGKRKIKLYRDSEGEIKGDGLCCYLKVESMPLVLNILDGLTLRGSTISVEKAQFVQKGDYNPALKRKKPKKKKGHKQTKLLDWRERKSAADGPIRKKCERIIVFRNTFDPKEFDEDPTVITDIRNDLQEECSQFGTVKKIMLFDRHPEGIASVAFAEFEAADMCVLKMNQRWYAGKQLDVAPWDGITNFQVEETDQERDERLEKWEAFLKDDDSGSSSSTTKETDPPASDKDKQLSDKGASS